MKKNILNPLLALIIIFINVGLVSCQNNKATQGDSIPTDVPKGGNVLSVSEFANQLLQDSTAQVVDVRTPKEFDGGHVKNALNININASNFEKQIATLDKTKPVFVYCLAGSRSAKAARYMRKKGFTTIYEMRGGILKWKAANKPLETKNTTAKKQGMSIDQFNQKVNTDKYVLVDYYAKWCRPCIKMAPMLAKLANEKKETLVLLKIDADENEALLKAKGVEEIPVLELYKNGKVIWKHNGFIDEATLLKETKL